MAKLIIVSLLFGLVTIPSSDEPKTVTIRAIETIQKSVVGIACVRPNAKGEIEHTKTVATGFFINRQGDFLTAAHLLDDLDKASKIKESNCFNTTAGIYVHTVPWKNRDAKAKVRLFQLKGCQYSGIIDVAVCTTIENPFMDKDVSSLIAPVAFSGSDYRDGHPVAFSGFPLGSAYPVTSKGNIAAFRTLKKDFLIDKTAWGGASGSPVYDADGKVLGMMIRTGIDEGAGLSYARPIKFIVEFLREKNIRIEK